MMGDNKCPSLDIEPVAFEPLLDVKILSSTDLASYINDVFNNVFADYEGCNINISFNEQGRYYSVTPSIYFKVLSKYDPNALYGFKTIKAANATDNVLIDKVKRVFRCNSMTGGNSQVEITKDAKGLLKPFLVSTAIGNNDEVRWENHYRITSNNTGLFVELFDIDTIKILKAIFGKKDKTGGGRYNYSIFPVGIIQSPYRKSDEWALRVTRVYEEADKDVARLLGCTNIQYGVNIITTTNK